MIEIPKDFDIDHPLVKFGSDVLFGHHPERGGPERDQAVFSILSAVFHKLDEEYKKPKVFDVILESRVRVVAKNPAHAKAEAIRVFKDNRVSVTSVSPRELDAVQEVKLPRYD